MTWWNSTDEMLEPGTRATLDAQRRDAVITNGILRWPCGCEQTRRQPHPRMHEHIMLHLCQYHMGFDDGLSVLKDPSLVGLDAAGSK